MVLVFCGRAGGLVSALASRIPGSDHDFLTRLPIRSHRSYLSLLNYLMGLVGTEDNAGPPNRHSH